MVHKLGRVSVIGAGTLGGTIAYSLLMGKHAKEILLVDRSNKIVQGQALDLEEACEGTDIIVRAGTFKEASQSSLVIFTASTPIYSSETREEWLVRSRNLLVSVVEVMSPVQSDIMILVATEPVDLFVQSFQDCFPTIPASQIFGIGTTMASIRFKSALAQMTDSNKSVVEDAYCIGSQANPVIVWSQAKVKEVSISDIPVLVSQRKSLETIVSDHRHRLICERKGEAWYGLSAVITRLTVDLMAGATKNKGKGKATDDDVNTEGSSEDTHQSWVLSTYVPKYNACLSWPVQVRGKGIEYIIDLPLTPDESAKVLKVAQSNVSDYQISMGISSSS